MPLDFVLGLNAKIYYRVGGVTGSGTWTELTNVKDVTQNGETAEADVSTRGGNGWRATASTLKDGSIDFSMVWSPSDAGFVAIKNAWLYSNKIGIRALDGDASTSGSQGLMFDAMVTNFSRSENLEEALMVDVSLKPTYSATAPTWYKVP